MVNGMSVATYQKKDNPPPPSHWTEREAALLARLQNAELTKDTGKQRSGSTSSGSGEGGGLSGGLRSLSGKLKRSTFGALV